MKTALIALLLLSFKAYSQSYQRCDYFNNQAFQMYELAQSDEYEADGRFQNGCRLLRDELVDLAKINFDKADSSYSAALRVSEVAKRNFQSLLNEGCRVDYDIYQYIWTLEAQIQRIQSSQRLLEAEDCAR